MPCVSSADTSHLGVRHPQPTNAKPHMPTQNHQLDVVHRREAPKHRRSCGFRRLRGAYFCDLARRVNRKSDPPGSLNCLLFRVKTGAGEGIRTLDPNLGKKTA